MMLSCRVLSHIIVTIMAASTVSTFRTTSTRSITMKINILGTLRDCVKNVSNAISKVFSPLDYNKKGDEIKIYTDSMKRSSRLVNCLNMMIVTYSVLIL